MTSSLDAVLAQYEQAQKNSSGGENRMSSEERMKKYFALILDEKSNSGTRRIRILPTKDGSSPFKEAWYHEIQVGGKWQKFYDPGKNDNERSPLNEVYEEQKNQIEQDMAPFGFISDGLDSGESFVDEDGDRWHVDEYGDMQYMWDYR